MNPAMQSSADDKADNAVQHRTFSRVSRESLGDEMVYVKHHLPWGGRDNMELVKTHLAEEVALLEQIQISKDFGPRLGKLRLVDYQLESAKIITREVPGEDLYSLFSKGRSQVAVPPFLAGKWLSKLQAIDPGSISFAERASRPPSLVDYCDIRVDRIRQQGYPWPDEPTRRHLMNWLEDSEKEDAADCRVVSHGDYGPGNLIWGNGVLTPIDFASCGLDHRLLDLSYFIHHLELLGMYFPWKRYPVSAWSKAILRGYGMPEANSVRIFRAMMVRHQLSRLNKNLQETSKRLRSKVHNAWIRNQLKTRIIQAIHA